MYKLNDNRINNEFIYKMNLSGLVKRPKFKQQFYFQLQLKCTS